LHPAVRAEASNRSFRRIRSSFNTHAFALQVCGGNDWTRPAPGPPGPAPRRAPRHRPGRAGARQRQRDHSRHQLARLRRIGWHTTADALLANTAAAKARAQRLTAHEELSITSW